jgi:hypothetical protein
MSNAVWTHDTARDHLRALIDKMVDDEPEVPEKKGKAFWDSFCEQHKGAFAKLDINGTHNEWCHQQQKYFRQVKKKNLKGAEAGEHHPVVSLGTAPCMHPGYVHAVAHSLTNAMHACL